MGEGCKPARWVTNAARAVGEEQQALCANKT